MDIKELDEQEKNFAIDFINNCLEKKEYKNILKKLSFEQRLYVFDKIKSQKYIGPSLINVLSNLFTNEEIIEIFKTEPILEDKKLYFYSFSIENQIKYANEILTKSWEYFTLLKKVPEENARIDLIKQMLDKNMIESYDISKILKYLNGDNQFSFLTNIFKYFKQTKKDFSSYEITNILEETDLEIRLKVLKEYEKYFPIKSLSYSEMRIISMLDGEHVLSYLFNKIDSGIHFNEYDLNIIYNQLSKENKKNMINEVIERNLISTYGYKMMFTDCSAEEKIQIYDYILNLVGENNITKYLSSSFIGGILNKVPVEIGEEILNKYYFKYYLSNDYYKNLSILNPIIDKNKKMYYLNSLVDFFDNETNIENIDQILNYLEREKSYAKGNIIYEKLIKTFTEKYNLNYENTCKFINSFGYQSLLYLKLNSINKLINLPKEKFDKFMNIIDISNAKMDNNTLNNICNSFLQRKFRITHSDDCEIFTKFEEIINNNSKNKREKLQKKLNYLNNQINIQKYLKKNNLSF